MRVPIPAGAFDAPKNTPQSFFRSQNAVLARKTHAYRTNPNICWDLRVPNPAGAFYAPQNMLQDVFVQLKCCFGATGLPEPGEPAADHGGTGRPGKTNRFL